MLLAVDVQYDEAASSACAAGVSFTSWEVAQPLAQYQSRISPIAAYEPGAFYRRELPCILQLLREHALQPECIVIDGYVYLDGHARPGLGHHLYEALDRKVAVIGVAKSAFAGIDPACALLRGDSQKALYLSVAGIDLAAARTAIATMHGPYRMPTLLKLVDQLCRAGLAA